MVDLRIASTLLVVFGAAHFASRPSAQSIKINGDLAQELRSGAVRAHGFTPDGTRLVYQADRATNGLVELFSVPTDGSAPSVRLHGPLPPGGQIRGWSIGAGNRVAYVSDETTQGVLELFSVPADASASPLLLSPNPAFSFWLNPAGDYVYFRDSVFLTRLQRVPIDGSAAPGVVAIGPDTPLRVLFSPDGVTALIVMFGDLDTFRLYSVPADGSGPLVQLHQTAAGNVLSQIRFAPDGVHVVFEEDQIEGIFFPNFLLSVPFDGSSAPVQLNTTPSYQEAGYVFDASSPLGRLAYQEGGVVFSIAYDGTQRATLTPPGWESDDDGFGALPILAVRGTDVVFAAHTVAGSSVLRAPLDGSQTGVALFAPSFTALSRPEVLAAGTVVFLAGNSAGSGLYAVPLAGGTPVLLSAPLVPNRGPQSFLVHPNGQQVAFLSNVSTGQKDELYVAPLDGSLAPLKLNAPLLPAGANVTSHAFTADGLSASFTADPLIDNLVGVFRAPLTGLGPVTQYNEPAPGSAIGGDVLEFRTTPDRKRIVYRADEDADESFDLFVAGTLGRGRAANLTVPLAGSVQPGFVLSPSGARVVFQSVEPSSFSLRSAPTTPGPAPIELDSSVSELPLPLGVTPDGTRVVYRKGGLVASDTALLSAPLDGSALPVTLHAPFAPGRAVLDFQISADGQFVVHRADEGLDNVFELFSVPIDGSTPPVRLHPPLASGRTVSSYRISPDGERVVFLADREVAGRFDLYSVPTEGGFMPRKLDPTLLSNRDVIDFAISPDGRSVVYRANALDAARTDLFLVPIDGLTPPARRESGELRKDTRIRLSASAAVRVVESDYTFSPDGSQVLFRANSPFATSRYDLFRVPADGSSAPVHLSTTQVSTRTVSAFALSPDQSRVVYLSDAVVNDVFEIFSVPLAGGPVLRLDPLPAFADVSSFRIDPTSRRVVYLADRNADNVLELFDVPLDGSAPAERLNAPLPTNGDVESDYVPLLGGRTLYRADQGTNDVLELFVSLERPVLPGRDPE